MEHVLKKLILTDEDYICDGDLTITGKVKLVNSNLIVAGILCFRNPNGENIPVDIIGGDISAFEVASQVPINIKSGDIYAHYMFVRSIESDGNIEIKHEVSADDISCLNFLVSGDSSTHNLTAHQDIYILGNNSSFDISGRDILISGNCDAHNNSITAKAFECRDFTVCNSISIG